MDKRKSEEQIIDEIESEEKAMDEIKSEEKVIDKMKRKCTIRLTKKINNDLNKINFILDNISLKMYYLKEIETLYNKSISEKILLLIKNLKMIDSDYLRDK